MMSSGLRRRWLGCLLCVAGIAPAQAFQPNQGAGPSFQCHLARTAVEKWICDDAALAVADLKMAGAFAGLSGRSANPSALRVEQRRWLRVRNRCKDIDCVKARYDERNASLENALQAVLVLPNFPLLTLPPASIHRIAKINDSHVLRFSLPPAAGRQTFQWEFYPDPGDHAHLFSEGPFAGIHCKPPDAREGYAARFEFRKRNAGMSIAPIRRGTREGYLLVRMEMGKDLPLNEQANCIFHFSSWLLDRPSLLFMVPVAD